MKLSELLYALEWLGVEETKEDILEINISPGKLVVVTRALDEDGFPFAADGEVAINTRSYPIDFER